MSRQLARAGPRRGRLLECPDAIGADRRERRPQLRPAARAAAGRPDLRDRGAGAARAGRAPGRGLHAQRAGHAGMPRPRHRHGHGQERPCRPQDRRHAGLHRHAGLLRAPGRGQPRRPGHGDGRRRGAGHLQQRRERRAGRHPAGDAAPRRDAGGDDRQGRIDAGPACRPRDLQRRRPGGLPDEPGAHRQHHRADGAGRCAGGGAARRARLPRGGLRALAPRRQPGPQAADACARPDAHRAARCRASARAPASSRCCAR